MSRSGRPPVAPEIRFWQKVNKTDDCWLWTAALSQSGYGWFGPCVIANKYYKTVRANRYSWWLHFGDLNGLWVLHKCHNRACVRPDHLYLGDHRQNMQDRKLAGNYQNKKNYWSEEAREKMSLNKIEWWKQRLSSEVPPSL